ncbi:hypothetical protein ACLQ3C_20430 [Gordonia sp. DT30]|uniref:hypothetical protein n=1 Tax=Gordonia sp. DT30 TaxID=3416546 RepID=UPI003CF47928
MSAVLDPATIDRWLRELAVLASAWDPAERNARWNSFRDGHSPTDIDDLLHVATHAVRVRVGELLDGRPTVEGVLGIAAMTMNRVGLDDPARTGSLLADCVVGAHDHIRTLDAQRLPWVLTAIGMPADIEELRTVFVTEWLRTQRIDTAESASTLRQAVLDSIVRAAPPGWQSITGSLCAAAGAARATLRVAHPDGDVGIGAPVRIPVLHQLRAIDADGGKPWWRAEVQITHDDSALVTTPAATPAPPVDLMRPSDYRAEAEVTGIALPPWIVEFCATGTVEPGTAPTLTPATATEAALIWWACKRIEVDARHVMVERVTDGYRVHARVGHDVLVAHVDDAGGVGSAADAA